ncbi:MAG: toll/interleukin-1 receptor domain-containing protein [Dermatophilaceae bacterium]
MADTLKVFVSWSGTLSRRFAEQVTWWLPRVIQSVEPFLSTKDIDKGERWASVLARQLDDAAFGVICLTPDNLTSPWLHYEAGAIAKSVDGRVCPLLFMVDKSDVNPPLSQHQLTAFEQEELLQLIHAVNNAAGKPLADIKVEESFQKWWPEFAERVAAISPVGEASAVAMGTEPARPRWTTEDATDEILRTVRRLAERLDAAEPGHFGGTSTRSAQPDLAARDQLRLLLERTLPIHITSYLEEDDSAGVTVRLSHLPQPLPEEAERQLAAWARNQDVELCLTDRQGAWITLGGSGDLGPR